ncbi:MAG: oxidative damage protection protein [Zoogloeaceae bacterium]|jgi:Fe-S cluster biosynthesis and repair protein YggX|nr:oxidative damage protection protein [Zoogloeaceae bacterium]
MTRNINCVKLGVDAEGLDFPPLPGALGQRIFEQVSREAWQQWIRLQTMIINENRLNMADPEHRKYLMEQVENHFFGQGADQLSGYVPLR